jgi:hypothetical protein
MNRFRTQIGIHAAILFFCLGFISCGKKSSHNSTGGRDLTPSEVSFEDIHLNATKEEVSAKVQPLRCGKSGYSGEVCTWFPPKKLRDLEGFEEVLISFKDEGVRGIEVKYAELFDLQYTRVNRTIRERYGPTGGTDIPDSVTCIWKYDSLTVRFSPNRKQHWTGSFYVYDPVLNIQITPPVKPAGQNE